MSMLDAQLVSKLTKTSISLKAVPLSGSKLFCLNQFPARLMCNQFFYRSVCFHGGLLLKMT